MMKLARNIILASIAAVAASCSDDTLPGTNPDNGERTPLNVAVALSNGTPLSRAEDKTFAAGDSLYAYIRQVQWDGTDKAEYYKTVVSKTADQSPSLVLFKVDNGFTMTDVDVDGTTKKTSNITPTKPLYWDDFSTSTNSLTADGRYLQSAWGFCYNGGTPTTALDKTNGTLGWTAAADFTPNGVLRKNDLLWSKAQKPLKYVRGTFEGNDHGTLVIPYTHAMSMITIEVVAADGFTTGNLGSTTATLQAMYTKATFSAPNATVSSQYGSQSVAMLASDEGTNAESKPNKVFQALVIPGKQLTAGNNLLAEIANVDGNNYKIPVTQKIIDAWREQLDDGKLKSGINYKLTVTVAKQPISVVAQITDWTTIDATGEGEIKFNSNIVSSGVTNAIIAGSFEIFRGTVNTEESLNNVTTATYNAGTSKWELTPQIYWANSTQSYYFRGLATTTDGTTPTATSSKDATQGTDLLWATTPAHDGIIESGGKWHFDAGVAIPPRTGDVPLQFEHAMSKITVNLSTSTTGKASPTDDESARAVNLSNVTVSISNIATAGTIAITDGNISPTPIAAAVPEAVTGTTPATVEYTAPITAIDGKIVIPQSLVNDTYPIKLTIKLSDGTTYSLPLKDCKVSGSETNIETWNRGKHYVYNIYVEKEAIRFVAVLKDWVEVNGGGNANLDWD